MRYDKASLQGNEEEKGSAGEGGALGKARIWESKPTNNKLLPFALLLLGGL
jgi:hypothetical protein